jgi:DNA polymerase III delta prime subunit
MNENETKTETPAEPIADMRALRSAVLDATTEWITHQDVQAEVVAARDRAGIPRPHVPVQNVQAACDELVEDGRLEAQKVDIIAGAFVETESGAITRYRRKPDDRATTKRRREALVRHLCPMPPSKKEGDADEETAVRDASALLERLTAESIGGTTRLLAEDLLELTKAGAVVPNTVGGVTAYALRESAAAELLAIGAAAIAERSLGAPSVAEIAEATPGPKPDAVGAEFLQKQQEALEAQTAARAKAEHDRDKLAAFLGEKGLDPNEIIGRKPVPVRKTFVWTQSRPVDMAEKGVIFEEVRKLEGKLASVQLTLDGAKATAKAAAADIESQIADLKAAADCNSRVLSVEAYTVVDWAAQEEIVLAVDDDRELERRDIVKGTQKTIPGTEAKPAALPPKEAKQKKGRKKKALPEGAEAASAEGEDAALDGADDDSADSAPGEKTPLLDPKAELYVVLRQAGRPLDQAEMVAALGERFILPEGIEALVRMSVAQEVKAGGIKVAQGKPTKWTLPGAATSSAKVAPVDEDEDEDAEPSDDAEEVAPPSEKPLPERPKRSAKGRRGKVQKTEARP